MMPCYRASLHRALPASRRSTSTRSKSDGWRNGSYPISSTCAACRSGLGRGSTDSRFWPGEKVRQLVLTSGPA